MAIQSIVPHTIATIPVVVMIGLVVRISATIISVIRVAVVMRKNQIQTSVSSMLVICAEGKLLMKRQECVLTVSVLNEDATLPSPLGLVIVYITNKYGLIIKPPCIMQGGFMQVFTLCCYNLRNML